MDHDFCHLFPHNSEEEVEGALRTIALLQVAVLGSFAASV